ncbi:MAG: coproporphyrinogen III oxidase family protein [Actinomycetes bacterium]|nr:coproporphyrinogen III oxidase family protein [Actinomycetes bacterium]
MLSERILSLATQQLNKNYLNGSAAAHVDRVPPPTSVSDARANANATGERDLGAASVAADGGHLYMLYMHVPFCRQLCTYCSFNRFYFEETRAREYFRSLRTEMEMVAELGYRFGATYIGGGTPTVLLDELAETLDLARRLFPDIRDVSTETNPTDLGDELFDALAGRVDRLSVGVQSFDNDLLQQMSRYKTTGTAEETLAAVQSMRGRFHSFNVDMIYNFPSQSMESLARDIELVKQTGCNQTTFYPLMASPLRRRQLREAVGRINYAREYDMYRMICERLADSFVASSAWTFSADKDMIIDEYIVDYPEYVGIGSGAMSYLQGRNYTNTFSLREYHDRVRSGRMGITKMSEGSAGRTVDMRYYFATKLFGLRLDKDDFRARFGVAIERGLPLEMAYMRLVGAFATNDAHEITLTDKGRYLMVALMRETLARSNDYRDEARAALSPDEYAELLEQAPAAAES